VAVAIDFQAAKIRSRSPAAASRSQPSDAPEVGLPRSPAPDRRSKPDRRFRFRRLSPTNRISLSDRVSTPLRRSLPERLSPLSRLPSSLIAASPLLNPRLKPPIRQLGEQVVKTGSRSGSALSAFFLQDVHPMTFPPADRPCDARVIRGTAGTRPTFSSARIANQEANHDPFID
jgi:hypothetical protein